MRTKFDILGFCVGWFAIITQFFLMLQNRQTDIPEMIIRFFSFFTILTNILVALYFTSSAFKLKSIPFKWFSSKGTLTSITAFILIVGLVYQIVLRQVWQPKGLQRIVDELLHTIIPLYVLIYWFYNVNKNNLYLKSILNWLLYPVFFLLFVLIRGNFSGYYPYPFVNVSEIGYEKTLINSSIILFIALTLLIILFLIGKAILNKHKKIQ
ncbi:Pr6Pr family membrane protein [Flavobacterium sp. P4023]|uniref:Pr6Pr family membrane protein n=1 Tax=Flavobacterium flabelliforme TaxID=2816119 RepID=A0ABS5CTU6_9FLAO|nr:Pr6Pr family membrane protein [Flavobacterium flabelliforme]MBP4142040.1 Pr6Pr family membrane protein [Flavobacterium flabelliforme]